MTWQIRVPHRDPGDSLVEVAGLARHLDGDDRLVAREVALGARLDGLATAGELLDRLERLEPNERRAMLDQARQACGLPSTADAEQQQHVATLIHRSQSPPLQRCAIHDCTVIPTNGLGVPAEGDVRRWHCPAHEHLASDEDMKPHGSGLRFSPSGVPVPDLPDDERREAIAAESARRLREAQAADRAVDADERREHQRAVAEQFDAELPPHLRGMAS